MRALAVLIAILMAALPLPAAAKRGLAGITSAPTDAGNSMRVVVVAPIVEGTLAPADRDALVAAAKRGLASESYEVIEADALVGDAKPCKTAICRHAIAERLDATHLLEMHVKAEARDYDVELRVYGADASQPFATASGSCTICGLVELEQLVASKSDALRQRLTSRELAPAYVQVSSVPTGSKVRIDGLDVGITPYSGELRPGSHTIEVLREGFFAESKKITAARGVRERFHTSLSPVPRHSTRRIVGWSSLGVGLASLAGGATLLALDGREVGRRCRDDSQRDADGDCKYVHKTLGGGIALTVAGATLTATGVTLLLVDRKRHKTYPLRASVSPRRVALSFKF